MVPRSHLHTVGLETPQHLLELLLRQGKRLAQSANLRRREQFVSLAVPRSQSLPEAGGLCRAHGYLTAILADVVLDARDGECVTAELLCYWFVGEPYPLAPTLCAPHSFLLQWIAPSQFIDHIWT